MVQLFRASELPPDIPGMVIIDGDDVAVIINESWSADQTSGACTRALANALFAAMSAPRRGLRAVV